MEHERIVYLLDYFTRCTDAKHMVTVRQLQEYLAKETNMTGVSPLTIRRDIARLQLAGNAIECVAGAHNTYQYYMEQKGFTFNEIRFLVDSVSINKFLSPKRKHRLIKKFESLCSAAQVRQLISRVSLEGQGDPPYDLLDNLEKVHAVISERRIIHFDYGKFDLRKQMRYYQKNRQMVPVKVVYFNERFYLRCLNEQTGELRTYRVDRMKNIRAGEVSRIKRELPKPDGVVLDMFEPEYFTHVKLRISRVLLDDMLEQFGSFASVSEEGGREDCVAVTVKVGVGHGFFRWVMKYGENVEILAPADVRARFIELLRKVGTMYGVE